MSNLTEHAKTELERSGFFNKDGMYDGEIGNAVMELIEVFSKQGHSGMSAGIVRSLFTKLADYEPLMPLTGEDDEWNDVSEDMGKPCFQNKRCSRVFKDGDGNAYDINGKVFIDENGASYTCGESSVPVVFPYTPKTERIERKS